MAKKAKKVKKPRKAETIESVFTKIIASFYPPIHRDKDDFWVWNNIGEKILDYAPKIPSGFWGIWNRSKETKDLIKDRGFHVFLINETPEGKKIYEITFESKEREVDFSSVITSLNDGLQKLWDDQVKKFMKDEMKLF